MSKYTNEIEKRRTFAIISHPDAGKTTLTEKFLLYGGAINLAGSVKGKATAPPCSVRLDGDRKKREVFPLLSSVLQFSFMIGLLHLNISGYTGDIRISRRILTVH